MTRGYKKPRLHSGLLVVKCSTHMLEVPSPAEKVHPGLSQRAQVELKPGLSRLYRVAALAVMHLLFHSAVAVAYPCPATNGRLFGIMILGPVSLL